jgi:hypothetical protein
MEWHADEARKILMHAKRTSVASVLPQIAFVHITSPRSSFSCQQAGCVNTKLNNGKDPK